MFQTLGHRDGQDPRCLSQVKEDLPRTERRMNRTQRKKLSSFPRQLSSSSARPVSFSQHCLSHFLFLPLFILSRPYICKLSVQSPTLSLPAPFPTHSVSGADYMEILLSTRPHITGLQHHATLRCAMQGLTTGRESPGRVV